MSSVADLSTTGVQKAPDAVARVMAMEAKYRRAAEPVGPAVLGTDGYPGETCPKCGGHHYIRRQQDGARWYCLDCTITRGLDDPLPGGVETVTVAPRMAYPRQDPSGHQESAVNPPFLGEKGHSPKRRLVPPFVDAQDYPWQDSSNGT